MGPWRLPLTGTNRRKEERAISTASKSTTYIGICSTFHNMAFVQSLVSFVVTFPGATRSFVQRMIRNQFTHPILLLLIFECTVLSGELNNYHWSNSLLSRLPDAASHHQEDQRADDAKSSQSAHESADNCTSVRCARRVRHSHSSWSDASRRRVDNVSRKSDDGDGDGSVGRSDHRVGVVIRRVADYGDGGYDDGFN